MFNILTFNLNVDVTLLKTGLIEMKQRLLLEKVN